MAIRPRTKPPAAARAALLPIATGAVLGLATCTTQVDVQVVIEAGTSDGCDGGTCRGCDSDTDTECAPETVCDGGACTTGPPAEDGGRLDGSRPEPDVDPRMATCAMLECGANEECAIESGVARCQCAAGYALDGDGCVGVDACDQPPGPCLNGGHCSSTPEGYACTCVSGFGGDHCERDLRPFNLDRDDAAGGSPRAVANDYLYATPIETGTDPVLLEELGVVLWRPGSQPHRSSGDCPTPDNHPPEGTRSTSGPRSVCRPVCSRRRGSIAHFGAHRTPLRYRWLRTRGLPRPRKLRRRTTGKKARRPRRAEYTPPRHKRLVWGTDHRRSPHHPATRHDRNRRRPGWRPPRCPNHLGRPWARPCRKRRPEGAEWRKVNTALGPPGAAIREVCHTRFDESKEALQLSLTLPWVMASSAATVYQVLDDGRFHST